jgi:hypothetical protein
LREFTILFGWQNSIERSKERYGARSAVLESQSDWGFAFINFNLAHERVVFSELDIG